MKRDPDNENLSTRSDEFGYVMTEFPEPMIFVNGSGTPQAVKGGHLSRLKQQLEVYPNMVQDHMGLLASVKRRVANEMARKAPNGRSTVSPFCHVSYIPIAPRKGLVGGIQTRSFTEPGESTPVTLPMLIHGLDVMHLFEQLDIPEDSPPPSAEAINEKIKRRP